MTAYQAACIVLAFLLLLYGLEWLGVVGARFAEAIRRAHLRGCERLFAYDQHRLRVELAHATARHPSGFLPRWVDVTDRVRSVSFAPLPPLDIPPLPPLRFAPTWHPRFAPTWHPRDHDEA